MPVRRRMSPSWSRRARLRAESRLLKGSSSSTTLGSGARARASATRCCCPPDSSWGKRPPRPARPTSSSISSALPAAPSAAATRARTPRSRWSAGGGRGRSPGRPCPRPALRRHPCTGPRDHATVHRDGPPVRDLQAGDQAQERALSAPALPHQPQHFPVRHRDVHGRHRRGPARVYRFATPSSRSMGSAGAGSVGRSMRRMPFVIAASAVAIGSPLIAATPG
jgi:hypothetical protein